MQSPAPGIVAHDNLIQDTTNKIGQVALALLKLQVELKAENGPSTNTILDTLQAASEPLQRLAVAWQDENEGHAPAASRLEWLPPVTRARSSSDSDIHSFSDSLDEKGSPSVSHSNSIPTDRVAYFDDPLVTKREPVVQRRPRYQAVIHASMAPSVTEKISVVPVMSSSKTVFHGNEDRFSDYRERAGLSNKSPEEMRLYLQKWTKLPSRVIKEGTEAY